jgi:pantoate--beta-alanine ligase
MRELEREPIPLITVIGAGRAGGSIARAGEAAGLRIALAGREEIDSAARRSEIALLCVPDAAIADVAARIADAVPPLRLVGHTSGAVGIDALAAPRERGAETFVLHPLQTLPDPGSDLLGAGCAVSGSGPEAIAFAHDLAKRLGMRPFELDDEARAAYHAAASIASNFLIALEESASELLSRTGVADPRELLSPLVLRTAANWSERGASALTGPIARGDEATVERHLAALREVAPELLPLYEAMAERTRAVSASVDLLPTGGRKSTRPAMKLVRTKAELRAALTAPRRVGVRIGLVPTMGSLHEGHLSLLRAARSDCDLVVMSLFVNPTQFAPGEDLDRYPRDEERDLALAEREGVDVVYAPGAAEVYPDGFASAVEVAGPLTETLEADPEQRGSEHFRGVTTVVAKLFNAVQPDIAYFGQKDAQQAVVIKRMAVDLDFPVQIKVLPTVREPDGLAMSSRNTYLSESERERALALSRSLESVRARADAGESLGDALTSARDEIGAAGMHVEYLEARDAEDLSEISSFNGRPVLVAVAARIGETRLIDNIVIGGN